MAVNLPIDEMLLELRSALEAFQDNPVPFIFDLVQMETQRILHECENLILEEE